MDRSAALVTHDDVIPASGPELLLTGRTYSQVTFSRIIECSLWTSSQLILFTLLKTMR
jgi:hypothetical protein